MTAQRIDQRQRVFGVVAQVLGVPADQISEGTSPDSVERWDSMSHLNLVVALEAEFGIALTDDDVTDMLSVGLILRILRERGVPSL